MKYLLLLALLVAQPAFATRKGAPFHPHDDKRFDEVEDRAVLIEAQLAEESEDGTVVRKQARFVYDVAVDGGSSTANKALGVTIPAGAVITKAMLYINTAFTDSGTGSLAIQCAGTRDIIGYTDITALAMNTLIIGGYEDAQTNAAASGVLIPETGSLTAVTTALNSVVTACEVTAIVRGDSGYVPLTAGKLTGILEYFQKD